MNIDSFVARRHELARRMQHGVAVIATAPEKLRNRDTHYSFRPDSYFHHLTGFDEPEAVLVVIAGASPRSVLFCRERDELREIWDGYRMGPERAKAQLGVDEAFPIGQLDTKLAELIANQQQLYYMTGSDAAWDARMMSVLNAVRAQARAGVSAPAILSDVSVFLDDMRLIKDADEIAIMQRAADISAEAHKRAMRTTQPERYEYEIEAELLYEFRRQGSQAPAYGSIVASGAGACVLHYVSNNRQMQDGELLLIDAGCELDGYASDITRTFPVNGVFSPAQRDVYQLVLDAQSAAIATLRPGAKFIDDHDVAVRVLTQGLIDLGLLSDTLDQAIESGSYKRYYMHRTGHWLGRDVHDAGSYRGRPKADSFETEEWCTLEAGMVLTVEPGLYIRPADDIPKHFWNIGVRIEDDALITPDGCRILSQAAPKTISDIENLMAENRHAN